MTTKAEALSTVSSGDIVESRKVANNTYRYMTRDDVIHYRLHMTDVVCVHPDNSIVLDSGGWRTVTTKQRMNEYLPPGHYVSQTKGIWYLTTPKGTVRYYDGIIIEPDGSVEQPDAAEVAEEDVTLKLIAAYCKELRKRLDEGVNIQPNGGDCWLCMADTQILYDREPAEIWRKNRKLQNVDHLLEHVREKYIHGTLLVNAMLWAGYNPSTIQNYGLIWGGDTLVRTVRRFLKFQLGFNA